MSELKHAMTKLEASVERLCSLFRELTEQLRDWRLNPQNTHIPQRLINYFRHKYLVIDWCVRMFGYLADSVRGLSFASEGCAPQHIDKLMRETEETAREMVEVLTEIFTFVENLPPEERKRISTEVSRKLNELADNLCEELSWVEGEFAEIIRKMEGAPANLQGKLPIS